MAIRQRQTVLNIAIKHFKEFGLPLDIDFKSYTAIVGPREALHPISVKRSFKAWKYLTHAVRVQCPELADKPAPKPAPSKAPKPKSKGAVKPAARPAVKKDKDDE